MSQTLFINATLASMRGDSGYGLQQQAALLIDGDRIAWVGDMTARPRDDGIEIIDCEQRLLTPGLIDCHTHLVYGGDRADEFEMRLEGASYADIAARGGGILATVNATRQASAEALFAETLPRVQALLNEGVTTLEIKSGYGLESETEIKMLRVAARIERELGVRIQKTFLGAHALPPEYEGRADAYIDLVCDEMLPRAQREGLVDAVDVFIESIAFNLEQGERVLARAQDLGLPVKAHVEQLSDLGGAVMAAARGALSVDHLEYLAADDVAHLANNGTVAVLLPGAFYVLRETRLPPIAALREQRVAMALATDANPGSSPLHSLLLIMNMACTLFRMTPSEALRGVTVNAARALGMETQIGTLETGKKADIVVWNLQRPAMLSYRVGVNPCRAVMRAGRWRS
ncbi:MAG: imidazolonepropionase [Gammaproteobacteria bacterium]|nr:imidazolonepropionase [Gammaproteobacteria bacterium]MDH3535300.1 imidazolonepropionase [Gammaproteobacteria bacterium]